MGALECISGRARCPPLRSHGLSPKCLKRFFRPNAPRDVRISGNLNVGTSSIFNDFKVGKFVKMKIDTLDLDQRNVIDKKLSSGIYGLHPALAKSVKEWGVPADLCNGIFSVLEKPALILRRCIVEFIEKARTLGQTVAVCGRSGSGKSAALLSLASFLLSEGNVVLYIPDSKDCKLIRHEPSVLTILGLFSKVEQYDDGRYPYQRSTFCEGYYDQDKVSEDILRKFLAVNGTIMKDITHDGKDLYSSCIGGINNSKDATKKLREILGIVVNWKGGRGKARNVYILLDQMDRFFLSSKYYDGDTRIPMPAFTYVQPFVPLITGEIKLESGSVISAIEQPKSTEYDPPMITAINFCECISEYNDREKQRVDLSLCKKFCEDYRIKEGARKIDISEPKTEGILKYPNQYVPDISLFEKMNLKTFHLPMFSEEDINSLFSFYRLASIIPSNYDYTRSFTLKHLLVTGGNGKELFKFITQM